KNRQKDPQKQTKRPPKTDKKTPKNRQKDPQKQTKRPPKTDKKTPKRLCTRWESKDTADGKEVLKRIYKRD
ncbi:hypothetical protein, partial [Paracoccus liaowanqingii]|uniref:hypothetical protein n=1 Tax=Paracoccus liaowanqingii TaxID=2560053 RepID=UPI001981D934